MRRSGRRPNACAVSQPGSEQPARMFRASRVRFRSAFSPRAGSAAGGCAPRPSACGRPSGRRCSPSPCGASELMRSRRSSRPMRIAISIASAVSLTSNGLISTASASSRDAPAKVLRISTPSSSSRDATNSLATRFMPSCRLLTRQKSAARYKLEHAARLLMLVDQHDRPPVVLAEPRVDALDFAVGLLLQRLIGGQLAARGRGDLQQT